MGAHIVLEGSPTSYAQFRQWRGSGGGSGFGAVTASGPSSTGGDNRTIEIDFKTKQTDCLILYADSREGRRGFGQYVQLTLSGGTVRLRYNWGDGPGVITVRTHSSNRRGGGFGDGQWHSVAMIRTAADTAVIVDRLFTGSSAKSTWKRRSSGKGADAAASKAAKTAARRLQWPDGGGSANSTSYVYVGGLPSWYSDKIDALVLPTVLLEKRLRGAVRGLRYRDAVHNRVAVQDMVAYKVRLRI